LARFCQKENFKILNLKRNDFGCFYSPKVREEKNNLILKTPYLYTWFSLSSQKYRKMIKDLYFISGLYPDLAKSSKG
jgi:hypothetical protein